MTPQLSADYYVPPPPQRPFPVTLMAFFQFAKAGFLIFIAWLSLAGHYGRLASIPNLQDLTFLASHGKDPKGMLLLFLGLYAGAIGLGLWRLRRWARNSLVFSCGLMMVLWLSHHDFGTQILVMPAITEVEQQTVYILLLVDFAIFMYLKFNSEIASCFKRPSTA